MLRTAATGRAALATGAIVTDVAELAGFVPAEIGELIEVKRRAARQVLDADQVTAWRARLAAAIAAVDAATETSPLPVDPPEPAIAALDAWLRDVRKRHW